MRPPLLLAAALAVSGCAATTHTVDPTGPDLADANDAVAGRTVLVTLADGETYGADALRFGPDSTSWIDPDSQALLSIPTSAIAHVERHDRGRTARRVVGRGLIAGVVSGALVFGAAGYDSGGCIIFCSREPTPGERTEGALTFGAAGALTGGVAGLFYGALVGIASDPTERFVVEPAPPRASPADGR